VVVKIIPAAALTDRPLAAAARQLGGNTGAALISIGALISLYGYLTAQVLHAPRLAFALGENGDFPGFFARIHPRYRTPHIAILVFAGAVWCLASAGNFTWNVLLSSVGRLFIYGFACADLPVLRRKHPNADAYRLPGGNLFAAHGILFVALLASRMNRGEGVAILVTMTIAFASWLWTRNGPRGKAISNLKSRI
jgi:amino acid transporter